MRGVTRKITPASDKRGPQIPGTPIEEPAEAGGVLEWRFSSSDISLAGASTGRAPTAGLGAVVQGQPPTPEGPQRNEIPSSETAAFVPVLVRTSTTPDGAPMPLCATSTRPNWSAAAPVGAKKMARFAGRYPGGSWNTAHKNTPPLMTPSRCTMPKE